MTILANKTGVLLKSVFQTSKTGKNQDDCGSVFDYSDEEQRFAIADSATDTVFAHLWSKVLATGLVATGPFQFLESEQDLVEWLEPMQKAWKKMIEWDQSPKIAASQSEIGAFSTLLGLQILDPEPVSLLPETKPADAQIRWQAIAIGNSCLFQVRRDHLNYAFPLNRSDQFSTNPLVSSSLNKNPQLWRQFHQCQEVCYETDLFFLMTASLAQWFLLEYEQGRKPWAELYHLQDQNDFHEFITTLRNSGRIRNTDVSLLTFQIGQDEISISPAGYATQGQETELESLPEMDIPITNVVTESPEADGQKGTTFLVKETSKTKEKSKESQATGKHKSVQQGVRAPQFSSLDQPSVLKQIGKSIIGLLGKKEKEDEE